MKVLTKDQAQAWLNQPEHDQIVELECHERNDYVVITTNTGERYTFPLSVDSNCILTRKKPWHWPKPDETTPVDAKVWCRLDSDAPWSKRHYAGGSYAWKDGMTKWISESTKSSWDFIVLANPDDLDEIPPQGLEE